MPSLETIIIVGFAAFSLNITPGPSMLYVVSRSIAYGSTAGLMSATGLATGNFIHVILGVLGISYLIVKLPILYQTIRYFGAIYLVYIGIKVFWQIFREKRNKKNINIRKENKDIKSSTFHFFLRGMTIEFLNPSTALFYLSFLPQFINPSLGNLPIQTLILGSLVPTTALCIDCTAAITSGFAMKQLTQESLNDKFLHAFSGFVLICLGFYAAFK